MGRFWLAHAKSSPESIPLTQMDIRAIVVVGDSMICVRLLRKSRQMPYAAKNTTSTRPGPASAVFSLTPLDNIGVVLNSRSEQPLTHSQ